jgi:hypothetical protein
VAADAEALPLGDGQFDVVTSSFSAMFAPTTRLCCRRARSRVSPRGLGAPLAPPEARIALETLYRRLPNLTADFDQERQFVPSITARAIISQRASWSTG